MKVYLSVDMEGIAGIGHADPTNRGDAGYPAAVELMVGEAGLNAAVLGPWGVPVGLVSGDDALAEEAEAWLPWAEKVVVNGSPVTIEVEYRNAGEADHAAIAPGAERYGDRGVRFIAADAATAYRGFLAGVRLAGLVG